MSSNTIQKSLNQELKALNEEQQSLISDYLKILTTNSSDDTVEEEWERAIEILVKVEEDPKLLKFLELIDYFCSGNPEFFESDGEFRKFDNDRRTYFSEYVEVLAANKRSKVDFIIDDNFNGELSRLCKIEYPDTQNQFFAT